MLEMALRGIGGPNDAEFDEIRALDALFFTGLSYEEHERIAREVFMLGRGNDILRRGDTIYWSMNEELKNHWMEIGAEKGRKEGWKEGREEVRREIYDALVSRYSDSVMAMMSKGLSLETALPYVSEDIREDVRIYMAERQNKDSSNDDR